jgi:hypothetical protein
MPARKFTKKAKSAKQKRQWADVEKSALNRGASPGSAIRQANSVIKRGKKRG